MSPLTEGKLIDGRYRCLRRLGSGGMADVWLCEDPQLGRKVAIKVLHERYARDDEFLERFRREAAAMAEMQHPNVVGIFDRGEFEGTCYIAMEYVDGPTLRQLINRTDGVSVADAIGITRQILAGVKFAHARGIVHRDLKPGNVLIDRDGRVRIADFGIAQAGVSEITQTGSVLGTAEYLAPEQAQGRPVTAASDHYSIGAILYEMLTGQPPFQADSAVAVAMKHVTERPLAPSARNANVSAALDQVTLKALAKEPGNRYRNADEFLNALNGAAASRVPARDTQLHAAGPVSAPAPIGAGASSPVPLKIPPRRWPWYLLGGLIVIGLLAYLGFGRSPDQVLVPAVATGSLDERAATLILERRGFDVVVERVERDEAEGTVVEQTPPAGVEVDEESTVTIFVSTGPGTILVPGVAGATEQEATRLLREVGFDVKVRSQFSADLKVGLAIGTDPSVGREVTRGETVTLLISSGPEMALVPDLVGSLEADARRSLRRLGFIPDSEIRADAAPEGTVIEQDWPVGSERPVGSRVTIFVSDGSLQADPEPPPPEQDEIPSVVGLKEARAIGAFSNDFDVTVEYEAVTDAADDGRVISQDPEAGALADRGSTVTIVVGRLDDSPPGGGTTP